MARSSRNKAGNRSKVPTQTQSEGKIYRAALYLRLSVLDTRDRPENETLSNQQYMLEQYAAQHPDLRVEQIFTDNGETGTNFSRPAWNALMAECGKGTIDCIIVKDLSRLGRNYLETGEYLEMIFPVAGIRVIAVNDHYDSLTLTNGERLVSGLKNLVNDMYAKDISRKSSSALRQKQKNGLFIGSYAAYGYLKHPTDKNAIVVDPETAPIVRQIFQWKANGIGHTQICRRLNEAGVSAPCKYRLEKGILKDERYRQAVWAPRTIITILQNPVYLGHMAQGKHNGALYEAKGEQRAAPEDWIIVENTHEPIIHQELFDRAQAVMAQRTQAYHASRDRYSYFEKPENPLKGKVFCADCGKPLYRYKSVTSGGKYVSYIFQCRTHTLYLEEGCPKKYINEQELLQTILAVLQQKFRETAQQENIVVRLKKSAPYHSQAARLDGDIQKCQLQLQRLASLREDVYGDYSQGVLTRQEYSFAIVKYHGDAEEIQTKLDELEVSRQKMERTGDGTNQWAAACRRFGKAKKLTAAMVDTFIERVTVHADNRIEILLRFHDEYEDLFRCVAEWREAI